MRPGVAALAWCGVLAVGVAHAAWYDFTTDDAYIFARYARNVVEGVGWVYNPGERVEGYTSIVWVALGALGGALGLDYLVAVRAASALAAAACVGLVAAVAPSLGVSRTSPLAALAGLLVALNGSFACWSLGGLETPGWAAAVLLSAWLVGSLGPAPSRTLPAGLALALCALVRPEGAGLVAVLAGWWWLAARPPLARVAVLLAPALLVVAAQLAFRLVYYGEWLPNTVTAKVGATGSQVLRGAAYLAHFFRENGGAVPWAIPFAGAFAPRMPPAARTLSVAGLALAVGVVLVGGDAQPMHRFAVALVPLWALLAVALLAAALRIERVRLRRAAVAAAAAGIAWVGVDAALQTDPSRVYGSYRHARFHSQVEVPRWAAVGRWLAAHAQPGDSVALAPIGAVGYHSDLRVIDLLGLVDPHIARSSVPMGSGVSGHERHDGAYVLSRAPTYLLLGNVQVLPQRLPLTNPQFARPNNRRIRAREDDLFVPELYERYARRVARLPSGEFLHYLERR